MKMNKTHGSPVKVVYIKGYPHLGSEERMSCSPRTSLHFDSHAHMCTHAYTASRGVRDRGPGAMLFSKACALGKLP